MKYIFILFAIAILFTVNSFAASGNKPNQQILPFRNVSSSTKPSCTKGEQKHNGQYVFTCVSTNKWHRASSGASF